MSRWIVAAIAAMAAAYLISPTRGSITVYDDGGGYVLEYAKAINTIIDIGYNVRIMGECASACTLFLSVPNDRLCIGPNARFAFHSAWGSTSLGNQLANRYMLARYPMWVNNWLGFRLTRELRYMPHQEAAKWIKPCK